MGPDFAYFSVFTGILQIHQQWLSSKNHHTVCEVWLSSWICHYCASPASNRVHKSKLEVRSPKPWQPCSRQRLGKARNTQWLKFLLWRSFSSLQNIRQEFQLPTSNFNFYAGRRDSNAGDSCVLRRTFHDPRQGRNASGVQLPLLRSGFSSKTKQERHSFSQGLKTDYAGFPSRKTLVCVWRIKLAWRSRNLFSTSELNASNPNDGCSSADQTLDAKL